MTDAEQATARASLLSSTRDDVVELALVRAMGLFEEFLGDLFLLGLQGHLGAEIVASYLVGSREEATLMVGGADVAGESWYLSWLPYQAKTLVRAKRLFEHGQPFTRLAYHGADASTLRDLTIVRNRVAHDSPSARNKFRELSTARGYPSARAADFLTSIRGSDTEILLALTRLGAIANGLAEPSEIGSRAHLSPEEPFRFDAIAPPGEYECQRGSHERSSTEYSRLGNCDLCPRPSGCPHCGQVDKVPTLWNRVG
ncbi:hypothetical protein F6W70_09485 [Microbacterium maritypicum]|uniref:Uncharacterized protein n=1 Tax=Microbacterium maritypicum TaxID=33918 RepID=A0AAD3X7G1_MICMQ|nr:hypothetical protein [Microbacterium liquefaciens]KAB1887590.1 hypothetical protein F6W70_09485 [Microbacterium liquefaciens]